MLWTLKSSPIFRFASLVFANTSIPLVAISSRCTTQMGVFALRRARRSAKLFRSLSGVGAVSNPEGLFTTTRYSSSKRTVYLGRSFASKVRALFPTSFFARSNAPPRFATIFWPTLGFRPATFTRVPFTNTPPISIRTRDFLRDNSGILLAKSWSSRNPLSSSSTRNCTFREAIKVSLNFRLNIWV